MRSKEPERSRRRRRRRTGTRNLEANEYEEIERDEPLYRIARDKIKSSYNNADPCK
jgi:hypothetical protein